MKKKTATESSNSNQLLTKKVDESSSMVVGSVTRNGLGYFYRNKKSLLIVIICLILMLFASWLLFNRKPNNTKATTPSFASSANKQIISDNLSSQVDINLQKLQSQAIDGKTYKNFDQAYQGALALYGVGDFQKAFKSFQIADSIGGGDYQFYQDYAACADANNNSPLATQLLQKALDLVSRDPTLPADLKANQIQTLTSLISSRQSGGS